MTLLLDTDIFLEVLLAQARAAEVRRLLCGEGREHAFALSDFSLHSIGVLLFRKRLASVFRAFVADIIDNAGCEVATVPLNDMDLVIDAARRFNLDFDDAYQYAIAEKHDAVIVSFDGDFDRTTRGRKTPAELLA